MDFNHDLANVAFEGVLQAQSAETLAELNRAVGAALRRIGYSHFVAVEFFGPAEDRQVRIIDGENDLAWQAHYISHGLAKLDPGVAAAAVSTAPFFRSDLQARGQVSLEQDRVLAESRSFGIEDTFFAPQHHVDGSLGAVVLTAKARVDKSVGGRTAAYLLAIHYGQLVRRFAPAHQHECRVHRHAPRISGDCAPASPQTTSVRERFSTSFAVNPAVPLRIEPAPCCRMGRHDSRRGALLSRRRKLIGNMRVRRSCIRCLRRPDGSGVRMP